MNSRTAEEVEALKKAEDFRLKESQLRHCEAVITGIKKRLP